MSAKRSGILAILIVFTLYTVWVVANGGGFSEVATAFGANPWIMQVTLDLGLALAMVCIWMWQDAKSRGANALPWIIATAFVGSIAPLAYWAFRPESQQ